MILVDSSVWIDFFNGNDTPETERLDELLGVEPIAIGDIIATEVLQGFREEADYRAAKSIIADLTMLELLGSERAIRAADVFRSLRKQGITVRKTIDVIIGAFCIDEKLPLLYSDRDFDPMVSKLGLRSALGVK